MEKKPLASCKHENIHKRLGNSPTAAMLSGNHLEIFFASVFIGEGIHEVTHMLPVGIWIISVALGPNGILFIF